RARALLRPRRRAPPSLRPLARRRARDRRRRRRHPPSHPGRLVRRTQAEREARSQRLRGERPEIVRPDLGRVIRTQRPAWGGASLPVEQELFGTDDPDAIAGAVDTWVHDELGSHIDHYEFFDASSGSVHGVVLEDGREVVVKGHRAAVTAAFLTAVT